MSELADLLEKYQRSMHPSTVAQPNPYRWRSWIDGPRGILGELMKGASNYGLHLTVEHHDRRWFRETVVFEVRGDDKAQVEAFRTAVAKWMTP